MNWAIIIPAGFLFVVVIVFLVRQNIKDKKKFEDQLKNDYRKSKDAEGDAEIDEVMK